MRYVLVMVIGLMIGGCSEREKPKQVSVRQRFVPAVGDDPARPGASWSQLRPAPDGREGVMWQQAYAGVGDSFPVQEKADEPIFTVVVVEGSDDELVLDIRLKDETKRLRVHRDKSAPFEVAGDKFDVYYPSLSVAAEPGATPTTDQAMIMVHRYR